jgi:Zn-dependent M28 family amino/carboxypeptidase
VPITFLITGAEEFGLLGATAHVEAARRSGALSPAAAARTYVLNFDGVGTGGRLAVVGGGRDDPGRRQGERGRRLLDEVRACCVELRLPLGRLPLIGALFDHIPFEEAGCDALSLVTVGRAAARAHTPGDTADLLEVEGFRQAGEVAVRVVGRIE